MHGGRKREERRVPVNLGVKVSATGILLQSKLPEDERVWDSERE